MAAHSDVAAIWQSASRLKPWNDRSGLAQRYEEPGLVADDLGEAALRLVPTDPAERMQQAMLTFFDLKDGLDLAGFSLELQQDFEQLRLRFVDEFERLHPGYGEGRALWR